MKKLLMVLLSLLMIVTLPVTALAADNDLSGLTDTIVTSANDLLGDKLSRTVTAGDVDFDNAFKIYVGIDIFKMDTTNINELKRALEDGGYMYELPLYVDGDTVLVDIAKGQPLDDSTSYTEEERQNVLANAGKWQVTAVKYYNDEIMNYTTEISDKIGDVPEGTILVGGLPHFRFAVALLPDEKGEVKGLLPLSEVPGVEKLHALKSVNQNYYDYKETKEYINQLPPPNPDEAGGFGFSNVEAPHSNNVGVYTLIIVAAIVCGIAVALFLYRRKVKTVDEKEEK